MAQGHPSSFEGPIKVFLSCRFVVLVRLHFEVQWKDDLVLFLRSIMHELSEAGLHMYLLVEVRLSCNAINH